LTALLACASSAPEPPAAPPSVLLVVLDTVRADHTELADAGKTPQLRAIGDAGLVFTDATAPGPWTWPSHASLFTGEAPWVHGAHGSSREDGMALKDTLRVTPLREDLPTLAGQLGGAGFRTEAFVANRLLSQPLGLTRDFDAVSFERDDAVVTRQAIEAMGGEEPLFLFVNLMSAHSPYHPSPGAPGPETQQWTEPWRTEDGGLSWFTRTPDAQQLLARGELEIPPEGLDLLDALYSGEVTRADFHLNQLVAAWQQARPHSVIAVTSDHGEYLGEHGFLEHSGSTYRQVTDIPLVLAGAGVEPGRIDTPVMLQDLYGTILELTGVAEAAVSLVRPDSLDPQRPVVSVAWTRPHLAEAVGGRLAEPWVSYRVGERAVVVHGETVELYATSDPTMSTDLADQEPALAASLAEAARAIPLNEVSGGVQVDPAMLSQLEALGYIQ